MRTVKGIAIVAAVLVVAPIAIAAEGLPPGKWWQRPEVVTQLSLSQEQQDRLDEAYRKNANDLIDLRAQVEKDTLALRSELDKNSLERKAVQGAAARLNASRGRLFERELMMLVDMRDVLTVEQWNRLRTQLERRRRAAQENRQQQPRRPRQP